ncbi:MAG: hypothetical protein QM673_11690 [Gordonia sp. (in: high G+C Gram-positive bacteria)]
MGTQFDGDRQRGRNRELSLAEYPVWGLDIMRGLYGPETIDRALAQSSERRHRSGGSKRLTSTQRPRTGASGSADRDGPASNTATLDKPSLEKPGRPPVNPELLSPMVAEIEAINAFLDFLRRRFGRR